MIHKVDRFDFLKQKEKHVSKKHPIKKKITGCLITFIALIIAIVPLIIAIILIATCTRCATQKSFFI